MQRSINIILITCLLCLSVSACSVGQDEIISTPERNEEISNTEIDTAEAERFGADVSFEITKAVSHEEISDYYCSVNEDGTLNLYLEVTSGTPYSIEGAIYDHDIFTMEESAKSSETDADGGGSSTRLYHFTPLKSGDTEIVTLNRYIVDNIYEGYIYNITVDSDLTCHINWCGNVTEGENLKVYE